MEIYKINQILEGEDIFISMLKSSKNKSTMSARAAIGISRDKSCTFVMRTQVLQSCYIEVFLLNHDMIYASLKGFYL